MAKNYELKNPNGSLVFVRGIKVKPFSTATAYLDNSAVRELRKFGVAITPTDKPKAELKRAPAKAALEPESPAEESPAEESPEPPKGAEEISSEGAAAESAEEVAPPAPTRRRRKKRRPKSEAE